MSTSPTGEPGSAAPAGWYDDGSGRLRWWDGRQWTSHFEATGGRRRQSRHRWWAWSPAYTLGLVAFIPAVHAAIVLRRRGLWLWACGLIAANALAWALLGSGPSDPEGPNTPVQNAGAVIAMVLAVLGTVHALRVRDEVFARPAPVDPAASAPVGQDPAVVASLAARKRREESAALSAQDPGLARDLRIGRPDLERRYDDGGLVDVNHVPEAILVTHLGLTPAQARTVVETRDRIGGFEVLAELTGLAEVPARTLEAVRDRIVLL